MKNTSHLAINALAAKHARHFMLLLLLAIFAWWPILHSPMLFYDDALRVFTHTSINQGVHGRPFADYIYYIFSSGFFCDISPLSQISCLAMIILGGLFVVKAFQSISPARGSRFANWLPLLLALVPLQYSIIGFRFDSITFGFAILFACLAFFLTAAKQHFAWQFLAGIMIFCVFAIYQPMVAIYLCLCCFYMALACLSAAWKNVLSLGMRCAAALSTGCILYVPVYLHARRMAASPFCGLENHPYVASHSGLLPPNNLPGGVWDNICFFLRVAESYLGPNPVSVCVAAGIISGFIAIVFHNASLFRKLAALLFAILAFFACGYYGLLLASPVYLPRTLVSLCFFVFCSWLAGLVLGNDLLKKFMGCLAITGIVISAFFLASLGNAQRDQANFENSMIVEPLTMDFMKLYEDNGPFSFFVRNDVPLHYTLREISREYAYCGQISGAAFLVMRELSWMNVRYALKDAVDPASDARLKSAPLLVSRLPYDIRDCGGKVYAVILKNDYLPENVQKFQSD